MAYYHPCKGCAVDTKTCPRREIIRSAVAGLSVTSIKFKCTERTPLFRAGQRVAFNWSIYPDGEETSYEDIEFAIFNGTIIGEAKRGQKFTVRVDQEGEFYDYAPKDVFRNGGDVVNVNASEISAKNEPSRTFCASCLQYEGETGRCQAHVGDRWDTYIPDGCLDHPIPE